MLLGIEPCLQLLLIIVCLLLLLRQLCLNATATYLDLRGDCGLHNRPSTQADDKIGKKFEKTGVVTNIERPVHHRFACSAENITIYVFFVFLSN